MREIKFRAWDNCEDRMFFPTRISFAGVVVYCYDPQEDYEYQIETEKLMQYTGLKDKSGVEIYEGDIVQGLIISPWNKREILCEVIFRKCCFICVENDNRGTEHKLLFAKDITVIGNIHQNPELLK